MLQFMESCHFSQQSKSHSEKAETEMEPSSSIVNSQAESEKDTATSSDLLSEALEDVSYLQLLLSHDITLQFCVEELSTVHGLSVRIATTFRYTIISWKLITHGLLQHHQ